MNLRKSLALLLCLLCLPVAAQQLGSWHMYLSYYNATKSASDGSIVYSLMNGNLLSYDTSDGEVRTYDQMGALSDVGISHIAYSKEAGKLLIVYSNCNIDLLSDDGTVQNLSALKDKRILDKEVSSVSICGSTAYLATGFGFVEVDMKEAVFRNTYRLSFNITCIAATDDIVFLAGSDGLYQCPKASNMQLEENWKKRTSWNSTKSMCAFGGKIIAHTWNDIYVIDPTSTTNTSYAKGKFSVLKVTGNKLFWLGANSLTFTTDLSSEPTTITQDNTWNDVAFAGGTFWMSEGENGLVAYKLAGEELVPTGEVIQPSSPIRDLGYRVSWVGNRLLVAGGINTVGSFYNPATAMYYENGEWTTSALVDKRGFCLVTWRGFEPRTHCLKGSCSAD